ncbi:MAG: FAD-dependent monooxygenase [Pseudomonadota bacterium]|nr:FAD-dependent monooxygenase [Pseudomonadota bacterium]
MQNGLNRIDGRIVIIGAGIGGLAAARALALRGAEVTVLEQAPAITEVGAGIQLGPNGTAVMRALGLDQALRDTGTPIGRALVLRNRHGARLARFPMSGLKRPDDYLFVHRADLIQVLEQGARAAGVTIDLGQRITGVRTGTPSNPMAVVETDGKEVTAPLVIGADGLHSVTARALGDRGQPFFTGQVAWRATVPEDPSPTAEVELYMAPGRHLVTYPMRGGTLRNIVAVEERSTWTEESWSRQDDPANLRAAFAQMGDRVQDLLARVETAHIWGLFRHPVPDRWHGTGVALMGDAVHPTLPFLAQGACMALEDAWVLAACLAGNSEQNLALARYQLRRHDRCRRIVDAATRNAWAYHLSGPLALGAHTGMRVLGALAPQKPIRSFAWLYDHDVTNA